MSGLINKAKEGLAKSKSKGDISRSPSHEHDLKPTPKASEPKKSENEVHWEELVKNMSRQLTLCDLDFTDLTVDDEKDVLAPRGLGGSIPPPPPPCGMMAPPPMNMFPNAPNNMIPPPSYRAMNGDGPKMNGDTNGAATIQKNKKTVSCQHFCVKMLRLCLFFDRSNFFGKKFAKT
jgi:FH1/FH2 domain-containing protein 3